MLERRGEIRGDGGGVTGVVVRGGRGDGSVETAEGFAEDGWTFGRQGGDAFDAGVDAVEEAVFVLGLSGEARAVTVVADVEGA